VTVPNSNELRGRLALPPRWPFDVTKAPFFYGWVIWLLSTLGFLMSVPGQTMGMAVFTDHFIDAFEIGRSQLSFAYLCGTIGSALLLTRAGRLYDRVGARVMVVGASIGLGTLVAFISIIDWLGAPVAALLGVSLSTVTMPLILLGYFGVRFTGQGVLTSASRNVLLLWFERRRGLVSGIRGVFVSLGFSVAPLVLALMIATFGWRGALWFMAGALVLGFSTLSLIFLRNSPAEVGLRADGESSVGNAPATRFHAPDRSLAEARRSPSFWLYSGGLAIHALFGTAVTFHIVSVFADAGRSQTEAFAYFLPQAVVSTSVNLIASALVDRRRLKPFLVAMLGAFLIGAVGLMFLEENWGYLMLVAGFGAGGGLWGVISNVAFIRLFGSLHLGEISGLNTSVTVFASAIGPFLFSLGHDLFGTYTSAELLCAMGIACLLVAAIVIRQPDDYRPQR
jgi:cyanate permease